MYVNGTTFSILIGGFTEQENLDILEEVLRRLARHNVRRNLEKCTFLQPEGVYLGLRFSTEGRRPVDSKGKGVKQAPAPRNVSELR